MRKIFVPAILLIAYVVTLCSPSEVFAQKDIQQIIKSINSKIRSIKTYHAILNTKIYSSCIYFEELNRKKGTAQNDSVGADTVVIGESGKKMKITTVFHTSESDIKIKYDLIYDGTWLWIDQESENTINNGNGKHIVSAMKISIAEVSPNPNKEPFNTYFLVSGNGLAPYKDLPGTFKEVLDSYDFNRIDGSENNREIIVTGIRKGKMVDNSSGNEADENNIYDNELFCHLKALKDNFLITSISYGKSENTICMDTDIEYVNINSKLPENIFSYQAKRGVVVRDITSKIKEKMKKGKNRSRGSK